jgi:hypothetical protein
VPGHRPGDVVLDPSELGPDADDTGHRRDEPGEKLCVGARLHLAPQRDLTVADVDLDVAARDPQAVADRVLSDLERDLVVGSAGTRARGPRE